MVTITESKIKFGKGINEQANSCITWGYTADYLELEDRQEQAYAGIIKKN